MNSQVRTSIGLDQPVASGASVIYTATFVDENDDPISASDLTSLFLTVADTKSGAIINGVDDLNIFNTDRGTVDAGGNVVVTLLPGDTVLADGIKTASRSLVLTWTYGADRVGRHEVTFRIFALSGDFN